MSVLDALGFNDGMDGEYGEDGEGHDGASMDIGDDADTAPHGAPASTAAHSILDGKVAFDMGGAGLAGLAGVGVLGGGGVGSETQTLDSQDTEAKQGEHKDQQEQKENRTRGNRGRNKKKRNRGTNKKGADGSGQTGQNKRRQRVWVKWKFGQLKDDDACEDFALALGRVLREKNLAMLSMIVEKIGNSVAKAIAIKAEKVQKDGGMALPNAKPRKLADGKTSRQMRTSGGVFIKLVRDEITDEMWAEINAGVKAEQKRLKAVETAALSHTTATGQPVVEASRFSRGRGSDKDDDDDDDDEEEIVRASDDDGS